MFCNWKAKPISKTPSWRAISDFTWTVSDLPNQFFFIKQLLCSLYVCTSAVYYVFPLLHNSCSSDKWKVSVNRHSSPSCVCRKAWLPLPPCTLFIFSYKSSKMEWKIRVQVLPSGIKPWMTQLGILHSTETDLYIAIEPLNMPDLIDLI